ncbi:hypothetical protein J2X31_000447 [Flavobacterium arsenatis]|uniref:Carboxypeptidase-like regulatory domain-containing protein n=1 Tax=Flavobacterium arsenatis TaxID=1484332 RepID=A0ABU1TKE1_9FLAO|nr:carboxypeptidase-like regulatory domain-containing protein [Flavobacterium arsenatis]MDR6966454.1 hypothetical protein [Flavobacterium arsenatis]
MKNSTLTIVLLFISQLFFAQQLPREILHGQIIADSISVEGITITNKTTNRYSVSDNEGNFSLYAREKDTLVFSSMNYSSKSVVLNSSDLKMKVLKIKLESHITELDEVVIDPNSLTGDLDKDSKNIKVTQIDPKINMKDALATQYEADGITAVYNKAMEGPGAIAPLFQPDLIKIVKMFGLFKDKKEDKKIAYTSTKIFPEAVQEKLPESFFLDTLKLKKDQIGLFLAYCENDSRAQGLLYANKEFELVDFLISKKPEYIKSLEKK